MKTLKYLVTVPIRLCYFLVSLPLMLVGPLVGIPGSEYIDWLRAVWIEDIRKLAED